MSEEGKETSRRRLTSPAAMDDDDLLSEILVRLPPQPSSLPRASTVCKRWRRLASERGFLRRFRARHRNPPILGVFEKHAGELLFTSFLDPPDRIPTERFSLQLDGGWSLLGCRHGRVLIISRSRNEILLFDPISGDRRRVPVPEEFVYSRFTANGGAVLSAAAGAAGDHQGPFQVVLVGTSDGQQRPAIACVSSSETGVWGDLISTAQPCAGHVTRLPCILISNAFYWWLSGSEDGILEFDLDTHSLAVIKRPPVANIHSGRGRITRAHDGGVGFAILLYPSFQIWHRNVDCHGVATWMLQKTVNMHDILGLRSWVSAGETAIVGYSEDADAILISVCSYLFMVQLESMQAREICGVFLENTYHPFTSFYTAGTASAQITAPVIRPPE